jgi:hypothetical protein
LFQLEIQTSDATVTYSQLHNIPYYEDLAVILFDPPVMGAKSMLEKGRGRRNRGEEGGEGRRRKGRGRRGKEEKQLEPSQAIPHDLLPTSQYSLLRGPSVILFDPLSWGPKVRWRKEEGGTK